MKITVAGVGYVGLSLAVLLAQNHEVTAITTTDAKAEKLNQFISPIQDDEIERFFKEAKEGKRKLNLHTTTDKEVAYGSAELVIIATPTNYDDEHHFFDTSAVEDAIEWTLKVNPNVLMVIKSTIPVGYTESVRKKYGVDNIIFSPEFLRESRRSMIICIRVALSLAAQTIRKNRDRCLQNCFLKVQEPRRNVLAHLIRTSRFCLHI